jgi:hypothetical protein
MLIAEFDGGNYTGQSLLGEQKTGARRRARLPDRYVVWAQSSNGCYRQVKEILP